jgi:hypothetical protein
MVERIPAEDEQRLADRLKREARATRPAFSEALHARICRAVSDSGPAARRRPSTSPWRHRWLLLAAAAALLLSVSLVAWWLAPPSASPTRSPGAKVAFVEPHEPTVDPEMITGPTGEMAEEFGKLVDSTLETGQWAYLDHDARVAAQFLMDQLPIDVASIE